MSEHDDEAGQTTRRGDLSRGGPSRHQPANSELSAGAGHKPANSELSAGADSGSEDLTVSRRDLKKGKPGRSGKAPKAAKAPEAAKAPKTPKAPKPPKASRAARRTDATGRRGIRGLLGRGATAPAGTEAPSQSFPSGSAPVARPNTSSRSSRLRELPQITLPRVQIPSALTDTGARLLDVTNSRLRPVVVQTEPVWRPIAAGLRWISPLGWTVLLLGIAAWIVAATWGWTELAMVAVGCLVLFVLCLLLAIGRTKLAITTEVDPARVTVGDPATGRIAVTNLSVRSLLPLLIELPVGRTAARFILPPLAAGKVHEELFVVPTQRRGVIEVGPATTVHGDPLGLVRRTVEWTDRTELFVHPLTTPLEPLGAGLLRDLEGQTTQDLSMSDLAFHALREYQPGDDRRYIHWRSSAKHGRLLVRQFLDTRRSHLSIVVDTTPDSYTGGEDAVELAISCAASLAMRSILDEQDTTVVVNDQSASRTTAPLTLDSLARASVGPVDVFASSGEASALAPDASVGLLVTGSHRPFIQIQRALAQFEVEVIKVALVIDPDTEVGVRRLGDITLLSVRELADLQRVLFSGVLA